VPSEGLGWGWRGLYYNGALPALIAVFVFRRLKEPDRWVAARAAAERAEGTKHLAASADLFTTRSEAKHHWSVWGGRGGTDRLWGVGFYTPELIDSAIPPLKSHSTPGGDDSSASSTDAHAAAVERSTSRRAQICLAGFTNDV